MALFMQHNFQLSPSPKDEASTWEAFPTEPVFDAGFVDATVLEFLEDVDAMPPGERLQRVQQYLVEDIVELRDTVRFSCDISLGFCVQEVDDPMSAINIVSNATRQVSFWEQQLEQRVNTGSVQYKDLLPSLDKPTPQDSEIYAHDDNQESVNNDPGNDEPIDISSGSSNDGGDVIVEQKYDFSRDKPSQQGSEIHVHDDNQESEIDNTGSGQPMDISSGSSDNGGGIITEQEEDSPKDPPEPQNAPGLPDHHPCRHEHPTRTPATTSPSTTPLASHTTPVASLSPAMAPRGRRRETSRRMKETESRKRPNDWHLDLLLLRVHVAFLSQSAEIAEQHHFAYSPSSLSNIGSLDST
ncbi:uncharacterized protein PG986_007395 [Apiospora aurea]|uniref:Uncharacterized protein n=1 Tax=Apiospora aurea TaxID=335848 RepID=A0ABR1QCF9_9PEZI